MKKRVYLQNYIKIMNYELNKYTFFSKYNLKKDMKKEENNEIDQNKENFKKRINNIYFDAVVYNILPRDYISSFSLSENISGISYFFNNNTHNFLIGYNESNISLDDYHLSSLIYLELCFILYSESMDKLYTECNNRALPFNLFKLFESIRVTHLFNKKYNRDFKLYEINNYNNFNINKYSFEEILKSFLVYNSYLDNNPYYELIRNNPFYNDFIKNKDIDTFSYKINELLSLDNELNSVFIKEASNNQVMENSNQLVFPNINLRVHDDYEIVKDKKYITSTQINIPTEIESAIPSSIEGIIYGPIEATTAFNKNILNNNVCINKEDIDKIYNENNLNIKIEFLGYIIEKYNDSFGTNEVLNPVFLCNGRIYKNTTPDKILNTIFFEYGITHIKVIGVKSMSYNINYSWKKNNQLQDYVNKTLTPHGHITFDISVSNKKSTISFISFHHNRFSSNEFIINLSSKFLYALNLSKYLMAVHIYKLIINAKNSTNVLDILDYYFNTLLNDENNKLDINDNNLDYLKEIEDLESIEDNENDFKNIKDLIKNKTTKDKNLNDKTFDIEQINKINIINNLVDIIILDPDKQHNNTLSKTQNKKDNKNINLTSNIEEYIHSKIYLSLKIEEIEFKVNDKTEKKSSLGYGFKQYKGIKFDIGKALDYNLLNKNVNYEFDYNKIVAYAKKLERILEKRVDKISTYNPNKRINSRAYILNRDKYFYKEIDYLKGKDNIFLIVDCSYSMEGLSIYNALTFVLILNVLAKKRLIRGTVAFSNTYGYLLQELPVKEDIINQITTNYSEGFEYTILENMKLIKKMSKIFVFTDGYYDFNEKILEQNKVKHKIYALYVGEHNVLDYLIEKFHNAIATNNLEDLITGILKLMYK